MIHPTIDNAAHIGGFVTGIVMGWLTAMPLDQTIRAALQETKLRLAAGMLGVIVVVGVVAAPRFDYSVREELKWSDTIKSFVEKEPAMISRQNTELARWQKSADNGATLAPLIDDELAPFYREFGRRIDALALTPGRRTDERRRALSKFVQLRLDAYQHLSRAVRQKNQTELKAYEKLETEASAVLMALAQARKPKPPAPNTK